MKTLSVDVIKRQGWSPRSAGSKYILACPLYINRRLPLPFPSEMFYESFQLLDTVLWALPLTLAPLLCLLLYWETSKLRWTLSISPSHLAHFINVDWPAPTCTYISSFSVISQLLIFMSFFSSTPLTWKYAPKIKQQKSLLPFSPSFF